MLLQIKEPLVMNGRRPALIHFSPGANPIAAVTLALALAFFVQSPASAQAPSGDPIRFDISVRAEVSEGTFMTVGGLYLNDLNTSVPLVLIDHALNEHWSLNAGYLSATRDVANGPDRTTQFIRLGVTYRETSAALTFDNRLAHEIVIDDQRDDVGGRVRNRMRFTAAPAAVGRHNLRLFAYLEPIVEYGLGRASRVDAGLGAGMTPAPGLSIDAYVLRQHFVQRPDASVDALVIQVQLQLQDRANQQK